MQTFEQWFEQDLTQPIITRHCESVMFTADNLVYTRTLSFILSDMVEYPIRPSALHAAVIDGMTATIVVSTAIPA